MKNFWKIKWCLAWKDLLMYLHVYLKLPWKKKSHRASESEAFDIESKNQAVWFSCGTVSKCDLRLTRLHASLHHSESRLWILRYHVTLPFAHFFILWWCFFVEGVSFTVLVSFIMKKKVANEFCYQSVLWSHEQESSWRSPLNTLTKKKKKLKQTSSSWSSGSLFCQ